MNAVLIANRVNQLFDSNEANNSVLCLDTFFYSPTPGPTQTKRPILSLIHGVSYLEDTAEAENSPSSGVEVKTACSYISSPQHVVMVW